MEKEKLESYVSPVVEVVTVAVEQGYASSSGGEGDTGGGVIPWE